MYVPLIYRNNPKPEGKIMSDEIKPTLHRRNTNTYVEVDGDLVGYVSRERVSNPSPRGGAYRTAHIAKTMRGKSIGFYDTRKEAIEVLILAARTSQQEPRQ